ncbi:MAG: sulfatase-like hydrolase/transferase, partial [Polyangiales bacterium]
MPRRRWPELQVKLRDALWPPGDATARAVSLAAGFALSLLIALWIGRAALLVIAAQDGLLTGLRPRQLWWLADELAHDLWTAWVIALLVGVAARYLPQRVRVGALGLGYVLLLLGCAIVVASVPLYAALQTTLQFTQLLLAGGVHDLFDAGLATLPLAVYLGALVALVLICLAVPLLAAAVYRRSPRLRRLPVVLALALTPALLTLLGRLAPQDATQNLSFSAVYDFGASIGRYYGRRHHEAVDMARAPHFDNSLMFGTPPPLDPTEKLVNLQRLPLRRPNVVLVVLESASMLHTGLWNGHPEDTPRLAEISKHGVMFDEYYSPSPVSMKSLFSLSCSWYRNAAPQAETYTNPGIDCLSISELLIDQDYRTGLFHGGHFSYTR